MPSAKIGQGRGSKVSAPAPVKPEIQKAVPTIEVPALSLVELKEKTDNFGSKALIGEGSYGRVYFAQLDSGKDVAVKKLDTSSENDSNNEFLTQVFGHTIPFQSIGFFSLSLFPSSRCLLSTSLVCT